MATPSKTPSKTSAAAPRKTSSAAASSKAKSAGEKKTAAGKASKTKQKSAAPAAKEAPKKAGKSAPGAPAKATVKAAAKTSSKAAPAPAPKTEKETKPAAAKPARAAETRETMTAEEKARLNKFRETLARLREDPEWPAFLEEQRAALLQLRDELVPNMQSVTRDHLRSGASNVSSTSGQHIGDAGSEAEVRDLTIRLLDKDREQIFEIDAALERIRRGTYGICEISLEPIPKGRLRVRPFCRLTVKCQEEYEKKYGSYANYRARNSDHVGFAGLQNDMESAISLDDSEE